MKKLTTTLLLLSMLATSFAFADDSLTTQQSASEEEIMLIADNAEAELPTDPVKATVSGIVKAVSDTQIELEDFVLNISDATYIGDYSFNPIEAVKEGDEIVAFVSQAQTRSLPPQSYAYFVLVKTDDAALAPIYTTVDSVSDEFITSADGNYELTYAEAEISMFKTKNIITAKELTKGSEIVFYSDIMTMSIPALANPSKILVLSVAEETTESVSIPEYLQEKGILNGTDKGLELERNVTRAEAVTFLSRVNQVNARSVVAESANFADVPETHWATPSINWAKSAGIIEGTGDGNFVPERCVSGKEFAKMLLLAGGDTEATIENALERGIEAKIITEDVKEKIESNADLTRNDVSILIYNQINTEE